MDELFDLSKKLLRIINRDYRRKFLKEAPFSARMTMLLGERGVGKSTAIAQYLQFMQEEEGVSEKEILYLPADHILIGARTLYEIVERFSLLGGKIVCFDEIHKYLDWSRDLKSIYDTFPDVKIIGSGSSSLLIQKGSHDLSRRAIVKKLYGFSFREYIELKTNIELPSYPIDELLANHEKIAEGIVSKMQDIGKKPLALFAEYIKVGYYPYSIECSSKEEFYTRLEQSAHTAIESDIQSVYPSITGGNIKKMVQLLAILARQVPFQPKLNDLTRMLDLRDQRTLKSYLKYLEDSGLIKTVSKEGKGLAVLEKPEKIYFNNTNQMYAFSAGAIERGTIRETYFVSAVAPVDPVYYSMHGDFLVKSYTFEVGGKSKKFTQIKDAKNGYLILDDIEIGINKKVPLWLMGFLY